MNVTVGHRNRKFKVYVVDGDYDGRVGIQQIVNEIELLQDILVNIENISSTSIGKPVATD